MGRAALSAEVRAGLEALRAHDHAEARRLLGPAAEQVDAATQFHLGLLHEQGLGGPQDHAEARRLYDLAAAQGDTEAQARASALRASALEQVGASLQSLALDGGPSADASSSEAKLEERA